MYRTIHASLWTDPKVRSLSVQSRYLFLYLVTNPHTHLSGIYYLPINTMQHETGLDRRGIDGALKGLLASNLIQYEHSVEQIWVVNMLKYQGRGQKIDKNVVQHLLTLHQSSLIPNFVSKYPHLSTYLPDGFLDTPSKGDTQNPFPVPDPSLLINQEAKKKPKMKRPISDDDKPTEKHYALGDQLGVNVGPEWGKFKNYCLAHDKRYADFEAAFRNWIANAPNMKGGQHAVR